MNSFSVSTATSIDMPQYVSIAATAQAKIHARGLAQWVPAAHESYATALSENIERDTVKRVEAATCDTAAFFVITTVPSEWWREATCAAVYLSGIVVAPHYKSCGVGDFILNWVEGYAIERHITCIRLDCHADNRWLCRYYERSGYGEVGRLEQHAGYVGALFEKRLANHADAASISQ